MYTQYPRGVCPIPVRGVPQNCGFWYRNLSIFMNCNKCPTVSERTPRGYPAGGVPQNCVFLHNCVKFN